MVAGILQSLDHNIHRTDRIQQRKMRSDLPHWSGGRARFGEDAGKAVRLNFDGKLGNQLIQFSATRRIGNWLNLRPGAAEYRRFEAAYLLGVLGPQPKRNPGNDPHLPAHRRVNLAAQRYS